MHNLIENVILAVSNNSNSFESLSEKIDIIDDNIKFNINLTWTILGFVVASAGVALYNLCKIWVNKQVEYLMKQNGKKLRDEMKERRKELKEVNKKIENLLPQYHVIVKKCSLGDDNITTLFMPQTVGDEDYEISYNPYTDFEVFYYDEGTRKNIPFEIYQVYKNSYDFHILSDKFSMDDKVYVKMKFINKEYCDCHVIDEYEENDEKIG